MRRQFFKGTYMFDQTSEKIAIVGIIALLIAATMSRSIAVINPGYTGIQIRLGEVIRANLGPGFYFTIPYIDSMKRINMRICKSEIETSAFSNDLQTVQIGVAINYKIENALKLYQTVGLNFEQVIIDPFTQESVKAIIAKYTAEDLIRYRHEAKEKVYIELKRRLKTLSIFLVDFNFIHLDFSADFIKAVEEKQIAEQSAKKSKHFTERIKEEAVQIKTAADAEAYSLNAKKETVTDKLIELKKIEAFVQAINKWDGVLPKVASSTIPLLDLK